MNYQNLSKDNNGPGIPRLSLLQNDLATSDEEVFCISRLPDMVSDRKDKISSMMRNDKSWRRRVLTTIIKEIADATDGNLALPHYVPSSKSKQELFVYEGVCWKKLDFDIYIDIVKKCALNIGLPKEYSNDKVFMNTLYEELALAVHHPFVNKVPNGEVWINLLNGTLRISGNANVRFDKHCREDYLTYVVPYEYDPDATCPTWLRFLDEVLPCKETQQVVQEFCGYCFSTDFSAEKMLVLKGFGSNGKSVFLSTLARLFGRENVSESELSAVTMDPERRSLLENKFVNISSESNKELDPAILKKMVSGESVDIRVLYKGSRPMTAIPKFITSYNQMPKPELTNAFFRRWLLVPFKKTFVGREADKKLDKKMIPELPGILNWVLDGLRRLVENEYNFTESAECEKELDNYRKSGDTVAMFVSECCCENYEGTPTAGAKVLEAYKSYCYNEELKPVGKKTLFDRLEHCLGIKRRDPNRVPYFELTLK